MELAKTKETEGWIYYQCSKCDIFKTEDGSSRHATKTELEEIVKHKISHGICMPCYEGVFYDTKQEVES